MPKPHKPAVAKSYKETIQALFSLSSQAGDTSVDEVVSLITQAPDPETARRAVAACVTMESEALARKWQEAIVDAWSNCHPHVPVLPHLALTEEDVQSIPVIRDVIEFLREISDRPAKVITEGKTSMLEPDDALRLALAMPSWQGIPDMAIEHEAAVYPAWRLRHVLQEIGLVRVYRGQLCAVKSRVEKFMQFPRVQQFYMVWHADVYHVNWGTFAPSWKRYIELVQGYLPLLWDMHSEIEAGLEEDSGLWTEDVMEAFLPLWEQEGITRPKHKNLLALYRDMTVPAAIKKLVFEDLLVRYNLVTPQYDKLMALLHGEEVQRAYVWTSVGEKLLAAERRNDLPCGLDLIKTK